MLFIAYLWCFAIARALATIPVAVTSNQPACPGESVAVQCTVGGSRLTWNTPEGAINIIRDRQVEGDAGSFHWTLLQLDGNTLQSTLTFSATTGFNIECSNITESAPVSVQVEGPPGALDRPLTALDRIQRINETFSSVSVVWDNPDTNNNYISRFVVTIDPPTFIPANGVIETTNPQFQARKFTFTLTHGQRYNIRVRADNCNNNQQGLNSAALTINIQVPPAVSSCASLPVYDYFSDHLTSIEIQWEPLPDSSEQITSGITADVQSYNVSIVPIGVTAPTINIMIDNNLNSCRDVCTYVFQNTSEMTALHYSVFVTAKNILIDGYGESTICSNQAISPTNDLLAVEIHHKGTDVEIFCRPLTRFEGEPHCDIAYSMDSYNYPYSSASNVLQSLEPNTAYFFKIHLQGGNLDVKVLGTFETGSEVLVERNTSHCLVSETETSIAHGMICYNGTTPGSVAYTVCDDGYLLEEEKVRATRKCLENGEWNGMQPQCSMSSTDRGKTEDTPSIVETCSTSLGVLGAATFIVSFLAGVVVGAIAIRFLRCRSKQEQVEAKIFNPVYDYISHRQPEREISTESNQCYTATVAPELPRARVTQAK